MSARAKHGIPGEVCAGTAIEHLHWVPVPFQRHQSLSGSTAHPTSVSVPPTSTIRSAAGTERPRLQRLHRAALGTCSTPDGPKLDTSERELTCVTLHPSGVPTYLPIALYGAYCPHFICISSGTPSSGALRIPSPSTSTLMPTPTPIPIPVPIHITELPRSLGRPRPPTQGTPSKPCSRCQGHVQTRYAPKTRSVTVVRMQPFVTAHVRLRVAVVADSGSSVELLLLLGACAGGLAALAELPAPICAATIGSGGRDLLLLLLEERGIKVWRRL